MTNSSNCDKQGHARLS